MRGKRMLRVFPLITGSKGWAIMLTKAIAGLKKG
jgi:hypothetical protein